MSVTQDIKNRLDIIDVIGGYVTLRKSGSSYTGLCPFHSNTRTPSFVVFPNTQSWRCFGACAEGGDIFGFMMKKEGWDFKEALKVLAQRAGVALVTQTPESQAKQVVQTRRSDLLTSAADYYHQLFLHAPQAAAVRQYMENRGITAETLAEFKIGFALDAWDACREHFGGQGYDAADLLAVGLLSQNEDRGTTYDRFRKRLIIPITDDSGQVVGFGARTLDPEGIPKYLNSPQTAFFDKSHLLFGLDKTKRHIREARQAVIVEGYLDVMQAWQAGFRNVVAQMGTALTEPQLALLKRYTKRFVIALDADAAGVKATLRSLEVARQSLERSDDVRFDAKGLIRHESRLKADIRVVALPEADDPDSLIRRDKAAWPLLIAQAEPIVAYVMGVITADLDMNDAKSKTKVAEAVLPLIADLPDPIERDHYRGQLARLLGIDIRSLLRLTPVKSAKKMRRVPPPPALTINGGAKGRGRPAAVDGLAAIRLREQNFLRMSLQRGSLWGEVNHILHSRGQAKVHVNDFTDPLDRALFEPLSEWVLHTNFVTLEELCDSLEATLRGYVQTLLKPSSRLEERIDISLDKPERLALSVLDWRLEKIQRQLQEMKQLYVVATQQEDVELVALYQQQILALSQAKQQLNSAKGAMSALSRRRAEEASF